MRKNIYSWKHWLLVNCPVCVGAPGARSESNRYSGLRSESNRYSGPRRKRIVTPAPGVKVIVTPASGVRVIVSSASGVSVIVTPASGVRGVVVVEVGPTISSKTLAYDCLCTLELCTASMTATS